MTRRINATDQLQSINDLCGEWKIAAIRANLGWTWCGTLGDHARAFNRDMFPLPGEEPKISCVTGRDSSGQEVLYARVYPQHLRRVIPKPPISAADWRRYG